ncbi:MAG: hypothetical protein E6Q88_14105 [Lysobacteraceae bacterium]|nr:MAG: hypothetical protein E6Q88_14105 [Xanthomonadaceae bacterium]
MCQFITAVMPADADAGALRKIFRAHGRAFGEYANPALMAQLPRGERCVWTTQGHCDCGTPLGAYPKEKVAATEHRRSERIARLRRRGWSEAKIARALDQHDAAEARERIFRGQEPPPTSLAQWLALIEAALNTKATPWLGLLLNTYRGDVESEAIVLLGREVVGHGQHREQTLAAMRHGTLYEFRR